jgi:hypothetical protein
MVVGQVEKKNAAGDDDDGEKFNGDDSQVSKLSYHDDDDDDDDDGTMNASAAFAAATGGNKGKKGNGNGIVDDDYPKICGVKRSRVLVVTAILIAGAVVGALAYYFSTKNEQQDFEAQVRFRFVSVRLKP